MFTFESRILWAHSSKNRDYLKLLKCGVFLWFFCLFLLFFFSCSMWTCSYSMWFPSFLTKNDLVFWLRMGPGPPALGVLATRPGKSLIHLLLKQLFICKNFLLQFGCLFSVHVLFLIFSVTAWFWYYWSVFLKCTIFDCPSFSSFFCFQKLFS